MKPKNKLKVGLAVLAVASFAAFKITDDWGPTLIVLCVVLTFLPPSFDPAIAWKEFQIRSAGGSQHKCRACGKPTSDHFPTCATCWWDGAEPRPRCYRDYPHRYPHMAAERDCDNCPHIQDCHNETPWEFQR